MSNEYESEDLGCFTVNIRVMLNSGGVGHTAIVYSVDNWDGDYFCGTTETKSRVIELVEERLVNLDCCAPIVAEVKKFLNSFPNMEN